MDSKCVVMNLNKDNCGLKGSDKKLIYFGEFWSRITSGAARGAPVVEHYLLLLQKKPEGFLPSAVCVYLFLFSLL